MEIISVTRVTGSPAMRKSRMRTSTPMLSPFSTTMTLAAAPSTVALPASVDEEARLSHSASFPACTAGDSSITAGTLLMRLETIRSISGAQPGPGSSVAKLFSGGHAQRVWETVVELQGHRALVRPAPQAEERDAMWYFLNTRCLTIAGGTTDVQLNIIGERILGLPRDPEPTKK